MKEIISILLTLSTTALAGRTLFSPPLFTVSNHLDTRSYYRTVISCQNISTIPQTLKVTVLPSSYVRSTNLNVTPVTTTVPAMGMQQFDLLVPCNLTTCKPFFCIYNMATGCAGYSPPAKSAAGSGIDIVATLNLQFDITENDGALTCQADPFTFGEGGTFIFVNQPRLAINGGRPF